MTDIEYVPFEARYGDDVLRLSRQVGWPHTREDLRLIIGLSEGIVALCDGRMAGTAFITRFGPAHCACNLIIVDETMRGRGLGRGLMDTIMTMAGACVKRLVATRDGLPLYRKFGFQETGRILQHQGLAAETALKSAARWSDSPRPDDLVALDRAAYGAPRTDLIASLMETGRVATLESGNRVEGFAVLRPFGRGDLIGPVVAADMEGAKALIGFILAQCAGRFMRIDIPETSGLASWLEAHGLVSAGGGVAMSSDPVADRGRADFQMFALANQALG